MMGEDQGEAPDQQGRLDRVITQYVRDLEAGSARSRQELIAGHPAARRIGSNCRYQSDVLHVVCSRDGTTAVLADWNGYGILRCLPQPVGGDPQHVTRWVQTEVGMQLDAGGRPQVLSGTAWQQLRERLRPSPSP